MIRLRRPLRPGARLMGASMMYLSSSGVRRPVAGRVHRRDAESPGRLQPPRNDLHERARRLRQMTVDCLQMTDRWHRLYLASIHFGPLVKQPITGTPPMLRRISIVASRVAILALGVMPASAATSRVIPIPAGSMEHCAGSGRFDGTSSRLAAAPGPVRDLGNTVLSGRMSHSWEDS